MFQSLLNLSSSGPIYHLPNSSILKTVQNFFSELFFLIFSSFLQTSTHTAPTPATRTPTYTQETLTLALFCVLMCVGIALFRANMVFKKVKDVPSCPTNTSASLVFPSLVSHTPTIVVLYSPPLAPPARLDDILPSSHRSLADEKEWARMKVMAIFLGLILMKPGEEKGTGAIEEEVHAPIPVFIVPALDSMPPTPIPPASMPTTPIPPQANSLTLPRVIESLAGHKARVRRTSLLQPGDWVSSHIAFRSTL